MTSDGLLICSISCSRSLAGLTRSQGCNIDASRKRLKIVETKENLSQVLATWQTRCVARKLLLVQTCQSSIIANTIGGPSLDNSLDTRVRRPRTPRSTCNHRERCTDGKSSDIIESQFFFCFFSEVRGSWGDLHQGSLVAVAPRRYRRRWNVLICRKRKRFEAIMCCPKL